jgi:L-rhamnose mutarotase
MQLKAGCKEEYRKRHDQIWPELATLIKSKGISDYSIFLDESTNTLFGVQNQSGEESSQDLGLNPIVIRWWEFMADLMETNPDNSPVMTSLEEVFYLE